MSDPGRDVPADDPIGARRVLILVGPSGSGKTVIGQRAAERSGWSLFDTDSAILRRTGATRISDIFDSGGGESKFRQLEAACMDEVEGLGGGLIVSTGGGLPEIPGMMARLNKVGVTVYLKADIDALWKRLNTDPRLLDDRPLLRDGGRERLLTLLERRRGLYATASLVLDTARLSVDEVCALLVTQISSMEQSSTPS